MLRRSVKITRSQKFSLRMTEDEAKIILDNAKISGLSMSGYIRKRALGKRVASKVEMHVVNELRRIGGLLKHVHVESKGAYSSKTMEVLKILEAYVLALSRGNLK